MPGWFNTLLAGLDQEAVTILGAGVAAVIVGVATGLRGFKKGKPAASASVQAISQVSCGAPDIQKQVRDLVTLMHEQRVRQIDMHDDLTRVVDKVTRIEDRTRR